MSQDNYRPSRFQLLPEVVKNLLIINGLMFVTTLVVKNTFGVDLERMLGLYYIGSPNFRIYQLVTHLFMHSSSDVWHILSNMFALWMFGSMLENYWGGKRFLVYYMITGLGAAFIHSAVVYYDVHVLQNAVEIFKSAPTLDSYVRLISTNPIPMEYQGAYESLASYWNSHPGDPLVLEQARTFTDKLVMFKMSIPTIGASGAVFGVLLAFGMLFPNTLLYVYFAIPVKAKYFVTFYGLAELYRGFQDNPADNVAHFAHLGGMLFGFIMIKFWHKKNRNYFY